MSLVHFKYGKKSEPGGDSSEQKQSEISYKGNRGFKSPSCLDIEECLTVMVMSSWRLTMQSLLLLIGFLWSTLQDLQNRNMSDLS